MFLGIGINPGEVKGVGTGAKRGGRTLGWLADAGDGDGGVAERPGDGLLDFVDGLAGQHAAIDDGGRGLRIVSPGCL